MFKCLIGGTETEFSSHLFATYDKALSVRKSVENFQKTLANQEQKPVGLDAKSDMK